MFGKKFISKIVSIFWKKILLKVVLDIVTIIYPTLLFGKTFIPKSRSVPIFGKKFLLKAFLHIVTIKYPTILFGEKFILEIVPICGENILLKDVLDIFTIVYHTFMFGKKFILKRLPNIWEENSFSRFTRHCYHYMSYVYIWEEIYSEMCTNICEENSSESCN